jgi:CpeT/CpcT family (DUF1001)
MRTLITTFAAAFEHMDVWESSSREEYFLTGYTEPLAIDFRRIDRAIRDPALRPELDDLHVNDAADLLGHYIGNRASLAGLIAQGEVSTDDRNLLEARIPRGLLLGQSIDVIDMLAAVRRPVAERLQLDRGDPFDAAFAKRTEDIFRSNPLCVELFKKMRLEKQVDFALAAEIARLNPSDPFAVNYFQQIDLMLNTFSTWLGGTFTNAEQAAEAPGVEERRLVAVYIPSKTPGQRWFYLEGAPADRLDQPDYQRVWRLTCDEGLDSILADVYDLPGDPLAHKQPWLQKPMFAGVGPGNLRERPGCGIRFHPKDWEWRGATEGQGCESASDGDTRSATEVSLTGQQDGRLPTRLSFWERTLDAAGHAIGGPPAPFAFVRTSQHLPQAAEQLAEEKK